MRLIDADAFVKELEVWHRDALTEKAELNAFFSSNFIDMVNMMPTVDAVPVIRCKDCRWYKTNYSWDGKEHRVCVIEAYEPVRKADDFCSRAERKEE